MKEFDYPIENIFTGIAPEKTVKKNSNTLIGCHNIEPLGKDTQLHEFIIDMNTNSYDWGNA